MAGWKYLQWQTGFYFFGGGRGKGGANLDSNQVAKESTRRQEKDLSKTEEPCTINNHTLLMLQKSDQALFWLFGILKRGENRIPNIKIPSTGN